MIDLSKPLGKEEMLAIIQILRELWKKQFGCDMPDIPVKPTISPTNRRSNPPTSYLSNNNKNQYHSSPALNKLSAELSDIKDKLKRFSNGRSSIDDKPKRSISESKSYGKLFLSYTYEKKQQFE